MGPRRQTSAGILREIPNASNPRRTRKGNRDRLLPLAPEFAEFLAQTPEAERRGRVLRPLGCRSDWLTAGRVCRIGSKIGEAAGVKVDEKAGKIKFASAHDLRRAFGLRWSRRVMPAQLKELMRHESIDTTMKYYVGQNAESTAATLWDTVSGNPSGNTSQNPASLPAQEKAESHC